MPPDTAARWPRWWSVLCGSRSPRRCGSTEHAAGDLLAVAEALVHRYPAALESLGRAAITEQHAQTLVSLLDAASPVVRGRLLARAVDLAEQTATGPFRRGLRRLIDLEDSATLAERHEAALTGRRVVVEPAADGLAWLHALIPAVEAHAIHNRLTAIGAEMKADPDEQRTLDQLRLTPWAICSSTATSARSFPSPAASAPPSPSPSLSCHFWATRPSPTSPRSSKVSARSPSTWPANCAAEPTDGCGCSRTLRPGSCCRSVAHSTGHRPH